MYGLLLHSLLRFVLGRGDSGPHNCLGGTITALGCDMEEHRGAKSLAAASSLLSCVVVVVVCVRVVLGTVCGHWVMPFVTCACSMLGTKHKFDSKARKSQVLQALRDNLQALRTHICNVDTMGLTTEQAERMARLRKALQDGHLE